ncbi:hypothetical protein GCM10010472_22520 [Pseudonocardia halophobica]|uniref:Uncharacterized protein n=1 Tax=Pseudonocardia halophobica TaxID=29401 RepID=A0A9W6KZK3_9PSEU|nr:hypothetical protein GCM10017577_06240 [Pseudonocardia halophobica]
MPKDPGPRTTDLARRTVGPEHRGPTALLSRSPGVAPLRSRDVRVIVSNRARGVHAEPERHDISPDAWYDTAGEALAAYE